MEAIQGEVLRDWSELPGPPGLPLIANTLQIDPPRLHAQLEAWANEYGPLFRLRMGNARILAVADHTLIAGVLRDRPDGFRRTSRQELIGREMGLKSGLFSANGDEWARQRRMVMAGFDPGHVKAYFPALLKVTRRLRNRWENTLSKGPSSSTDECHDQTSIGTPIDLQADLMRFTVDTITGLAFGQDVNTLESGDDVIQNHLDKILPTLFKRIISPIPWWRVFKRRDDRELDAAVVAVNAAIDGFVAQSRKLLDDEPQRRTHPTNLLEAMIAATEADGAQLTDEEVSGNVMTMLLAGEDTTANTLAWMIYLLARNPQAMARARNEVLQLAPDIESFTFESIGKLEFLDACAMETMRLKPVAPILPVQALRDTVIGGVRITAKTIVINVMRTDAIDERLVGAAQDFRPERWLRANSAAAAAPGATTGLTETPAMGGNSSLRRVSMPFGAGPRICPGRYLAMLEMRMAMAMLLAHFEISSVATANGMAPEEKLSFTMAPVGLKMQLTRRTRAS